MSSYDWQGGTTAVAQVDTLTAADTWAADDTLTTTLRSEDGSTTQAVQSTATGSTIETGVIDVHIAALQASTNSLFQKVTWAKASSSTITGTAKVAGIPFYCTASESTSGDGTWSRASTTASAGPHDWRTTGNWVGGSLPVSGAHSIDIGPHPTDEDANGNPKSYAILYGLETAGAGSGAVAVNTFNVGHSFRADVGDSANSYSLQLDVTNGSGVTVLNSGGPAVWIKGSHDDLTVAGCQPGRNAVRLSGTTLTAFRVLGAGVAGNVRVADGTAVTNAWILDCPGAVIRIGTGSVITALEMNTSTLLLDRNCTTLNLQGGTITQTTTATTTTINNRGGYILYNGKGTITTLNNYSGTTDFRQSIAVEGITVTNATIWGGLIVDRGGLNNVTYSNNIIVYGGDVQSDTGQTVTAA